MTDHDATALVIDAAQLVAEHDPGAALQLLGSTGTDRRHLQRAALAVLAFILSGDGAPERFAELRAQVHNLALQHGSDDRQVVLNLEVVATSLARPESRRSASRGPPSASPANACAGGSATTTRSSGGDCAITTESADG